MVVTYSLKFPAQDTDHLKNVWEVIDSTSCPSSYNFHLHTIASDGKLTPEQLVEQAIAIGLKGFAITDHHSVSGFRQAEACLNHLRTDNNNLPYLWTGTEITADLLDVEVHILGYGFDPDCTAIAPYLQGSKLLGIEASAERVIEAIHEAGGLAVLAHPERYRRPASQLIPAVARLNIDGVETYYAYNNPEVWQPSPGKTETVMALGEQYQLYNTCGTDTHGLNIMQRI